MIVCIKKHLLLFCIALYCIVVDANAQQVSRPPIAGIAYVQLQVSDLDKAMVFYTGVMGYRVSNGKTIPGTRRHACSIAINPRQSVKIRDGLPPGQDERLMELAFQTTDAAAMRMYLQSKGIEVPGTLSETAGVTGFSVRDPDGHRISFVQYPSTGNIQTHPVAQPVAISNRILHAGLTIASAKAANIFYGDILGFSEIWRGGSTDSVTSWINMRVPEGTDYLEYMLVAAPVGRQQLGSLHHIALMVPDMQAAVDKLAIASKRTGYTIAPPRIGRNNRWQLNLFDPDGTRIELMEPFPMR